MRSLLIALFTILITPMFAQEQTDSLKASTTLEELFTACNSSSHQGDTEDIIVFDRLASYIVFNGEDDDKKWKIACDYNKLDDRKIVDAFGKIVKAWLDDYSSYKITSYEKHIQDGGVWHVLFVTFVKEKEELNKIFEFIELGDKFLLGNIE